MPRWKTSSGKGVDIAYDGLTRAEIAKEKTYQASKSRGSGPKRSGRRAATRPSSRGTGPRRRGRR
jgi:hypothetical protein